MNSLSVILVCLLEVTIVFSAYSYDEEECIEEETPKLCPPDWTTFERPQGRWCVRVYVGPVTQAEGEAACRTENARLTGLQNAQEKDKILELAEALITKYSLTDVTTLRLGAARRAGCHWNSTCAPKESFAWTDKFTTGTDGFIFQPGEPNFNYWDKYGHQSCVQQIIRYPPYNPGNLDDIYCLQPMRLYACGKKP